MSSFPGNYKSSFDADKNYFKNQDQYMEGNFEESVAKNLTSVLHDAPIPKPN